MIYAFDIQTPAKTLVTAKKKTILRMERGLIYRLEIVFPPGPVHLLHLTINDALHQVWPTNQDADFAGNNDKIEFDEELNIDEPPYELQAYTWNEDEAYAHWVQIRIGIRSLVGVPVISLLPEQLAALLPY